MNNVRLVTAALLVVSASALTACTKNADGDLVVQTPRMETHTDTVKMPRVEMTKDTIVTITPTIVVKKETSMVVVPHATVTTAPKSKP